MSDSARSSKPRIVPAIPLNFAKPPSAKILATPDGSEPSGSDSRQEHVAVNGVSPKSARTAAPQRAPLTPESKSSTPANGDHVGVTDVETGSGGQSEELGDRKEPEPILPATPVSNAGSHSLIRTHGSSDAGETNDGQSEDGRYDTPMSNGVPAFSPQRGTYRMPPPFYPSEKSSSPTSQEHTSRKEHHKGEAAQSMHKSRPSAMSLVFGGLPDSSSSSPVPFTPSSTSGYPLPIHRPSSFTGNVNATPFYPAVAMPPFSEAQIEVGYSPVTSTAPAFPPFSSVQAWMPSGVPFQYPVPPSVVPVQLGQPLSQSLSQQSSARAGHARKSSEREISEHSQSQEQEVSDMVSRPPTGHESIPNSARTGAEPPESGTSEPTLEGHILSQFGKFDYADCVLEIYFANDPGSSLRWPAHRLVVARSPRVAAELVAASAMPEFDPMGLRVVRLWAPSSSATAPAFIEAIRHMYGAPLQAASSADVTDSSLEETKKTLSHDLGCIAAASVLEIPTLAQHALKDAISLLTWDTVEEALSFALEGAHSTSDSGHSSSGEAIPHNTKESIPNGKSDHDSSASYEQQLLEKVIDFLANNFPGDFPLDTTAAQLAHSPRLPPALVSSKPSMSDPRLSSIHFGDLNGESPTEEKSVSNLVSSILLSLPFSLLDRLLQSQALIPKIGDTKLEELMQSVIAERERRRFKGFKASKASKHTPSNSTGNFEAWDNLYWEERVKDSKLVRSHKQDDNTSTTTYAAAATAPSPSI